MPTSCFTPTKSPSRAGREIAARGEVATTGPGIDPATLTVDDAQFFETRPPMPRAEHRPSSNAGVVALRLSGRREWPGCHAWCRLSREHAGGTTTSRTGRDPGGCRRQPRQQRRPRPRWQDDRADLRPTRPCRERRLRDPQREIDTYLDDVKDGRYDGKLRVIDRYQALENEALRARLGLGKSVRGDHGQQDRPARSVLSDPRE